jgi:hypothetical protein
MGQPFADRTDLSDSDERGDERGDDGWRELAVANPDFLLERLGAECGDLQFLRELTVNGLDAIAAAEHVAAITETLAIRNAALMTERCQSNVAMASKLKRISNSVDQNRDKPQQTTSNNDPSARRGDRQTSCK